MKRLINSRLARVMSFTLVGTAALYGQTASAEFWPNLEEQQCMANAYLSFNDLTSLPKDALNCTANDIEITKVYPLTGDGGERIDLDDPTQEALECNEGEQFTIWADVEVKTNANERYDYTFYLPNGEWDAEVVQSDADNDCALLVAEPGVGGSGQGDPGFSLDSDQCADIKKPPQIVTHVNQKLTLFCTDGTNGTPPDGFADFRYCAAWDNQERTNCTVDPNGEVDLSSDDPLDRINGQVPNTKSKCNCDVLNIPVFIAPKPATITKSVTPLTGEEPGKTFTYTVEIKPDSTSASSVFVNKIEDVLSSSTDPVGTSQTFLLNDGTSNEIGVTKGKYTLLSTNTDKDCEDITLPLEIEPTSLGLTCTFKIKIDDEDLPNVPSPEKFENFIRATIVDKNGNPVPVDGNDCSVAGSPNCSNEKIVTLTNVAPTIKVTKTASPDSIVENTVGIPVTYTVKIENTSPVDAVNITTITDSVDGGTPVDLAGDADCQVGTILAIGETCTFTYTRDVTGNVGDDPSENKVKVTAKDNENDDAEDWDIASVAFTNSPGAIELIKKPDASAPGEATESGEDVVFTFTIKNTSPVDNITLTSLIDDQFGVIFDSTSHQGTCNFYNDVLVPGETRECTITKFLSGEPSTPHLNTAEVTGETDDVVPEIVKDSDDGKVIFLDEPADINLAVDLSLTLFLTIENTSTHEPVFLDAIQLEGANVVDGAGTAHYIIKNDGGSFNGIAFVACPQGTTELPYEIVAAGTLRCAFTVDLLTSDDSVNNIFSLTQLGSELQVKVSDNDGGAAAEPFVTINAQLEPGL